MRLNDLATSTDIFVAIVIMHPI